MLAGSFKSGSYIDYFVLAPVITFTCDAEGILLV